MFIKRAPRFILKSATKAKKFFVFLPMCGFGKQLLVCVYVTLTREYIYYSN